ncbi:hypothetical protein B0T19DRAFT_487869 [Cercophora scortea]|uniref:AAA+ ATPase domain-containing protein n=1 Tax=Cercophora scortea TaxID=314031 RepID=A0AAE0M520_9PEZI|nr:hypothetical protein B0T19DRAFT_487869 [Cercophora scortea]
MLSIISASTSASTSQSQSVHGSGRDDSTEVTCYDSSPETSKVDLSSTTDKLPVADGDTQKLKPAPTDEAGAAVSTAASDIETEYDEAKGNAQDPEPEPYGYESDASGSSRDNYYLSNLGFTSYQQKLVIQKRARQHAEHILVTEDRLRSLQEQVDKLLRILPEEQPAEDLPAEDLPAEELPAEREKKPTPKVAIIPELRFLAWCEFNKENPRNQTWEEDFPKTRHVIDVLHGEPVLFHSQEHKLKKGHMMENDKSKSGHSESEADNLPMATIPERIRINSFPLMQVLKKVIGRRFRYERDPLVILRPYKPLLYHDGELREKLTALEEKWAVRSGKLAPVTTVNTNASTDPDNTSEPTNKTPENRTAAGQNAGAKDSGAVKAAVETTLEPDETQEAMEQLRCLVRFMDAIKPLVASIRAVPTQVSGVANTMKPETARVSFKDLWYLFEPGQEVLVRGDSTSGFQKLWRVVQATGGRSYLSLDSSSSDGSNAQKTRPLTLDCYYIDFDGRFFGPIYERFFIGAFEETKDVTTLDVFPAGFSPEYHDLITRLTARGQEFVKATKMSHKFFKGRTLARTPSGHRVKATDTDMPLHPEVVESAVIVDFDRTLQFNPGWSPDMISGWELAEGSDRETTESGLWCQKPKCFHGKTNKILPDFEWDAQRREDFVSHESIFSTNWSEENYMVSPNDFKLFPNRVFGFVLRTRKWACLPVDGLKDIDRNGKSFDALELSGHNKEIVVGLVDSHFRDKEAADNAEDGLEDRGFDLVRAKGKGLIILLHGAPGVGKTSTAECVADSNRRPLFPITCGDLGLKPLEVERSLDFNFQLAESWGCILLLDEADVFLAQRTHNDIERNALVSIFLRALEYYSGILFLTTNRVGSIDEAFRSRIHMSLLYPPLSELQTIKIWEGQLNRAEVSHPHLKMDKAEILNYMKILYKTQMGKRKAGWNGRQIQNAMKTAVALAEYDGMLSSGKSNTRVQPCLDTKWFHLVANASWEFDSYLEDALSMSQNDYSRIHSLRADNAHREKGSLSMPDIMNSSGSPVGTGPSFSSMGTGGFPQQHQQQSHMMPQRTSSIFGSLPSMTQDDSQQQQPPSSIFGQPYPVSIPEQTQLPNFQQAYQQQAQAQAQVPQLQQQAGYSNFFSAAGMPMGHPAGIPRPASLYGGAPTMAQNASPGQGLGQFQYPTQQHPFQTHNTSMQQPQQLQQQLQQQQPQQPFSQFLGAIGNSAGAMQYGIPQGQVQQGQGQPSPFSNPLQPAFQGYPPTQAGMAQQQQQQQQQQPQTTISADDGTTQ